MSIAGILGWPFSLSISSSTTWTSHANEQSARMCGGSHGYRPPIVAQVVALTHTYSPRAAYTMISRLAASLEQSAPQTVRSGPMGHKQSCLPSIRSLMWPQYCHTSAHLSSRCAGGRADQSCGAQHERSALLGCQPKRLVNACTFSTREGNYLKTHDVKTMLTVPGALSRCRPAK